MYSKNSVNAPVISHRGTLITTDPPAKQILLYLNSTLDPEDQFLIVDLDATHVVIKPERLEFVQKALAIHLEQNTYTKLQDDGRKKSGKGKGRTAGIGGGEDMDVDDDDDYANDQ